MNNYKLLKKHLILKIPTVLFVFLISNPGIPNAADQIHWSFTGQTSITVNWRGAFDENIIHYGTKSGAYTNTVTASPPTPMPFSSSGPFWEAKIDGLEENTTYYYSIGESPEYSFHTPLEIGKSGFTIFAQADIGDTSSYFQVGVIQDIIADGKPDFVVAVGDLTYGNAHGQDAVDQHFNDVMAWSTDAAYMPVWGNHEWDKSTDDLRNYKGRFDFPNPQTSTNSPAISCCGEDWYWFDYGNTRFITLPEPWSGAWYEWRDQATTLMEQAQTNPDIKFIVTFVHRPAYSSGHHPGSTTLQKILNNLGDQFTKYVLNINGHSHNYERSHPQHGVIHVTAGTGGSSLETDGSCLWKTCKKPSWSAFRVMHLGVLKLNFNTDSIEGVFICGPSSIGKNDITCNLGEEIDRFSIGRNNTDDTTPPTIPANIIATSTPSQVNLKWQAATDNVRVSGYKIHQNGIHVGDSTTPSFNINGLQSSTNYIYTIAAFDPTGNLSIQSKPVNITTKKASFTGNASKKLIFTPTDDATIKYNYPSKNFGMKKLETDKRSLEQFLLKFKISGTNKGTISSAKLLLYNINSSNKGGDFYYVPNNNWSESSVTWKNAPVANNNPIASLGAVSAKNWYEVDLTSLIKSDGTYSFIIKSTSSNGADYKSKEYPKYQPRLVITLTDTESIDSISPTTPKELKADLILTTQIKLSWLAATDNVGIDGYKVFRDGILITNTKSTSFSDTALTPGTAFTYSIIAVDKTGNDSKPSDSLTVSTKTNPLPPSSTATLTFFPTDDATVKPGYPLKNFGLKKLETDNNSIEHFLIKFNVSGIDQQSISSAKLRLYNINGSNKGGDFYRVINNAWSELSVNWKTMPRSENKVIASLGTVIANNWYEIDLSQLITGNGIYSLIVKSTSNNGADYYSKEHPNYSPQLIITIKNASGNTTNSQTHKTKPNSVSVQPPTPNSAKLITDPNLAFSIPKLTRLPYLTATVDPIFGTKIIRIAGDTDKSTLPVKGTWGSDVRHHYSKDQPWNSDGSLLVLQNSNSPSQIYLDGTNYQPKYGKCKNYSPWDDRWHPSKLHPNERINVNRDKLEWFNIVNCTKTRQWQLPFPVNYIGSGEGNISNDGRYVLLADKTRMFLVDMDPQQPYKPYKKNNNKRIGPARILSDCGLKDCSIDWVSVSPSGKYAVVSYNGDHLRIFNIDPKTLALTPRAMPKNSVQCGNKNPSSGYIYDLGHADMTLNPFDNNEDVIIGQRREWCPKFVGDNEMGGIVMVRLKDNKIISLTDPNIRTFPQHISARNVERPGWVFVSFYNYPSNRYSFNDEIIALKIDGSMSVERLAHKHTILEDCYRCEAHPVPSPKGQRVMWAQYFPAAKSEIKACVVDSKF